MTKKAQMAVLIDADNLSVTAVEQALVAAAKLGEIRRICAYRDWKHAGGDWNALVARHAIRQIQQFACAKRKNASDISLTIDAMDYFHKGVRAFCLMSSDSDYTPLALRLRRGDAKVYGFGSAATPKALREACDGFEVIETAKSVPANSAMKPQALSRPIDRIYTPKVRTALIDALTILPRDEQGWVHLSQVKDYIAKKVPAFKLTTAVRMPDIIVHSGVADLRREGSPAAKLRAA